MWLDNKLIFQLILNISLLVMIATLLSKVQFIQESITEERRNWKTTILLSAIFAGIIILSTCTSITVENYQLNTRVIGAMAAGILGGPLIGLYASFASSIFVYFFVEPQSFAMASAFSTVLFGLLGGGFYPYFQRGKWKYKDLFFLTCFAELCEMIAILRLVTPFTSALHTVGLISLPMIILNSLGILIFISSFNQIFIRQDIESSHKLQIASELSRKCIPLFRQGLKKGEHIKELAHVILQETEWAGIMITDKKQILEWQQNKLEYEWGDHKEIPDIGKDAMEHQKLTTIYKVQHGNDYYEMLKDYSIVAVPFIVDDVSVGTIIAWMKKRWVFHQSELELLQNIVTIGSFQLAIAELDHQRNLTQQAELKALQFQINPHFLFNALNTISCVCREDGERARELLVILADYFRYNLDGDRFWVPLEEELEHVKDYLSLEKGRFEEKLQVEYEVPQKIDLQVPALILQPIVENAVRYGIGKDGMRWVKLSITKDSEQWIVQVIDKGAGFDKEILKQILDKTYAGKSIGLLNVTQRMVSTYGESYQPLIHSTKLGSCVELHFPIEQ